MTNSEQASDNRDQAVELVAQAASEIRAGRSEHGPRALRLLDQALALLSETPRPAEPEPATE